MGRAYGLPRFVLFSGVEQGAHTGEITDPGCSSRFGEVNSRLGTSTFKTLFYFDISGIFQLSEVGRQIAISRIHLFLEFAENGGRNC